MTTSSSTPLPFDEIEKPISISLPVQKKHSMLFNLPIAWRLLLGFLAAALIAGIAIGVVGIQRTTSLNRQSDFYQSLVRTNHTLTNGSSLLQLMTSKTNEALSEAASPTPSQETIALTLDAIQRLIDRYETDLTRYINVDLLSKHPEYATLLATTNEGKSQTTKQRTVANSALRTWKVYRSIQEQVFQYVVSGNIQGAQYVQRFQAEPTNKDAFSAVGALIQCNEESIAIVHNASLTEAQYILWITIICASIACVLIMLIGVCIAYSLHQRFKQFARAAQNIEQGDIHARFATEEGTDEISRASSSINTVLDMLEGLREKVQSQRDGMTYAAEYLIAQMKSVNRESLRMNSIDNEDPITTLTSTFHQTLERLHDLTQRIQFIAEHCKTIARQEYELATSFARAMNGQNSSEFIKQWQQAGNELTQRIIYLAGQQTNLAQELGRISTLFHFDKNKFSGERIDDRKIAQSPSFPLNPTMAHGKEEEQESSGRREGKCL